MTANQLRIGNIVNFEQTSHIITEIASNFCRSVWHRKNPGEIYIHGYSEINPIPLTEEWLIKFGFNRHGFHFNLNYFQIIYENGNEFSYEYRFSGIEFNNLYIKNSINYVHQLQNLYFDLTGEELEIKQS